jgi:hypothetical protein
LLFTLLILGALGGFFLFPASGGGTVLPVAVLGGIPGFLVYLF